MREGTPVELCASTAVPPALARRRGGGSASAVAALLGWLAASAGAAPLAGLLLLTAIGLGLYARHWLVARGSQSGRRSLRGRGSAGARSAAGGGLAAAALAAVAGTGRHRLGGDRSHRHCGRDRDEDQDRTTAPSRSGARAGGLAVTTPAKVGTQRRPWRHVPRPCAGRRARRARRSGGLDRPLDPCPSRRGGDAPRSAIERLIGSAT